MVPLGIYQSCASVETWYQVKPRQRYQLYPKPAASEGEEKSVQTSSEWTEVVKRERSWLPLLLSRMSHPKRMQHRRYRQNNSSRIQQKSGRSRLIGEARHAAAETEAATTGAISPAATRTAGTAATSGASRAGPVYGVRGNASTSMLLVEKREEGRGRQQNNQEREESCK